MKRWFGQLMVVTGAAIALSACGSAVSSSGSSTTSAPYAVAGNSPPSPSASTTPLSTAGLGVRTTNLGKILVDGRGLSVYLFEADKGSTSACYGACAQAWPPVLTNGSPVALPGIDRMLIGTTRRSDGSLQVTYAGHPLYFFVGDRAAGQTTGEGLENFGGGWDVVAPNGNKIEGGA